MSVGLLEPEVHMQVHKRPVMVAAVVGFLLVLFWTSGNLVAAVSTLMIAAGMGWAVRGLCHAAFVERAS